MVSKLRHLHLGAANHVVIWFSISAPWLPAVLYLGTVAILPTQCEHQHQPHEAHPRMRVSDVFGSSRRECERHADGWPDHVEHVVRVIQNVKTSFVEAVEIGVKSPLRPSLFVSPSNITPLHVALELILLTPS